MKNDSLSTKIDSFTETINEVVNLESKQDLLNFDFQQALLIAFIASIITQGLIILITWLKRKFELAEKKNLLEEDLKNQKNVLTKLRNQLEILKGKLEKRQAEMHKYDSFEDLHIDIYNSILKTDLHKMYGKKISKIINLYKTIEFLTTYSVHKIYSDYVTKVDNHLREKRDDKNHKQYCDTHLGFAEVAIEQSKDNIETIDKWLVEVEEFI